MSKQHLYADYYAQQSGAGLPTFRGLPTMQGHGFGSIFTNIFRHIQPFLAPFFRSARNEAIQGGIRVLSDIAQKKPLGESVKQNLKTAGRNLIVSSLKKMEGRGGIKRIGCSKNKQLVRRRSPRDIFSIAK
jgi:hypothetical protein